MRAAGVASAADYTPWWGHRDNNHAWPVILDAEGRGRSGDGNRAAKVYRKTYSKQRQNLVFQLREGEQAPRWLDRETYRDVTDQYFATSDVRVALPDHGERRFAYLCVFNGGEWRPIHWGRISGGVALFAHGWFNRMLRPELKRQGWTCVRDGGDGYWSWRRYELKR